MTSNTSENTSNNDSTPLDTVIMGGIKEKLELRVTIKPARIQKVNLPVGKHIAIYNHTVNSSDRFDLFYCRMDVKILTDGPS